MKKINVEICFGTTCFVMGGSQLQELESALPEELKERVNILPQNCMGLCRDEKFNQAPYAKINGQVIDSATIDRIINTIKKAVHE